MSDFIGIFAHFPLYAHACYNKEQTDKCPSMLDIARIERIEDMTKDMTNGIQTMQPGGQHQGEIILYQPDETVRLEVRLEDDTVWLTTSQMALLFDREESNIRRHILNVFSEDELERSNNVQNLHVNGVKKPVPFYSLDVIISVGYRVKSKRGTKFRQWANRVLRGRPVRVAAYAQSFHDRFLIIDDSLWHCGASFKDLGRRLFAIDRLNIDKSIILSQL